MYIQATAHHEWRTLSKTPSNLPERISQRGHPIINLLVGIRDQALADRVLALEQKVQNAAQRALGQQRLLVQVDDPVVVVQKIHVVLESVLQGARLVSGVCLGAVFARYHYLSDTGVTGQVQGLVSDDFNDELVHSLKT